MTRITKKTRMTEMIKLMRPKHYLKNVLVLAPLFFGLGIFDRHLLGRCILGCAIFSLLSSVIYIINDLNDLESDRNCLAKKNRPLAAGTVSVREAKVLLGILVLSLVFLNALLGFAGGLWLALYFILNLAYSVKLKQLPIIDVVILASGFLIRLLYGAAVTQINLSFWLCMTVVSFSFFMGLGKRRNELTGGGEQAYEVRSVLRYYNKGFFDKNMYMCLGLAITFYALWSGNAETIEKLGTNIQMWTVPIVIILAMKYSLNIEKGETADPMEIILNDRWLLVIGFFYVLMMWAILYF